MDQRDGVASGARHILVIPGRLLSGSYVDGIAKRTSGRPRQGSRYNQPLERGEGNSWPGVMGIALSWIYPNNNNITSCKYKIYQIITLFKRYNT